MRESHFQPHIEDRPFNTRKRIPRLRVLPGNPQKHAQGRKQVESRPNLHDAIDAG